jgi:uncharacterized membrane protein
MLTKPLRKFYWDVNSINFVVTLAFIFSFGILWGAVIFSSFGLLIGLLNFHYWKNQEYYLYHNLGYSKLKLFRIIFLLNIAISFLLLLFQYI